MSSGIDKNSALLARRLMVGNRCAHFYRLVLGKIEIGNGEVEMDLFGRSVIWPCGLAVVGDMYTCDEEAGRRGHGREVSVAVCNGPAE